MDKHGTFNLAVCTRKIAFGDGVGGMERAAADHIRGMVDAGAVVTVYTPIRFLQGSVPDGVTIRDVPWPRWNAGTGRPTFGIAYRVWAKRLSRTLSGDAEGMDVVHFHGGSVGALPLSTAGASFATVANPHGMEEFGPSGISRLPNRYFLRRLGRKGRLASCVIATDKQLVDPVIKNLQVSPEKVKVIPNAVDVESLHALARQAVPPTRFTIVTIGRLVNNKGYDLLLEALKLDQTRRMLPEAYAWIHFGSGPEREKLLAWAALPPQVNLEVRSQRPDTEVQMTLSVANLFIQPSRYEGSSLTTLEAMAHGRIVVGTAVGGIPDKISEGVTGFLAKEASVTDIAYAIQRAAVATDVVGQRAFHLVNDSFSTTATHAMYVDLYRTLKDVAKH